MPLLYHPTTGHSFLAEPTDSRIINGGYVETTGDLFPAYTRIEVGPGYATALPDMDFETYSEAGHIYDETAKKWKKPPGVNKKGLPLVGMSVYAKHPSTEVLSLAYDLKDGAGARLWLPGCPPPADLFDHIARGGLLEAHNCGFEFLIWDEICRKQWGWPALPIEQQRDSAEKARAASWPGKLAKLTEQIGCEIVKDKDGDRLLKKFSDPKNPTKAQPGRRRIRPEDDPEDAAKLYGYNITDIQSEADASVRIPDLPPEELAFAIATRRMNRRGVGVDVEAVEACIAILEQAYAKYDAELRAITCGAVPEASKVARLIEWLGTRGVFTPNLDDEALTGLLKREDLDPVARRALEIRQLVGSAGVKKLYAMRYQATPDQRLEDLFIYHGARTGRDTGADVQPQNLVKAGPAIRWCENDGCGKPFGEHRLTCPHCGASEAFSEPAEWSWQAVDHALEVIRSGSLEWVEYVFGDAVLTLSGCIRGLFVAAPGHDLICSDYSSIEAVVTAMLAGEEWRIEAFRRREDIYYHGAAGITGKSYDWYKAYAAEHGAKHSDRQKIGKPAELGLGFGGWVGAWFQFDKSGNFTEQEVKRNIIAWREASPAIVELWGGQVRGKPWDPDRYELHGLEGAAIAAVQNPGTAYGHRFISYQMKGAALYCRLPSGRLLTYHRPRLAPSTRWDGQLELSYEGWNSNPKMGPVGWIRINTYGGRLAENAVQATARDILRDAVLRLEAAGYPIVLRVHDELIAEVPAGTGSIEEFEHLMGIMPEWAADWPIRAAGGWRGKRYRKD